MRYCLTGKSYIILSIDKKYIIVKQTKVFIVSMFLFLIAYDMYYARIMHFEGLLFDGWHFDGLHFDSFKYEQTVLSVSWMKADLFNF